MAGEEAGASRIAIGFFGAGLIARVHAQRLEAVPGAYASAVFDPDRPRAAEFARRTGAVDCKDPDGVFARSEAVFICTWTSEHAWLVEEAASRRLPIFCEKPLAGDLGTAAAMEASVRNAGVPNQVGLVLRYSPAFYWLRALLADPGSGRMLSLNFRDDQYLPVNGGYGSTWRADASLAGSGVLLEHSIHDVDIIEYLAGPIERLSCTTRSLHGIPGIEDVAVVSFLCQGGVPGTLTTVWHDITDRGDARRVEVFTERLWCALDGNFHSGPVSWKRVGEPEQRLEGVALYDRAREAGLVEQDEVAAFISSVRERRTPEPGFGVGLRAHHVVDAAYRSAADGGRSVETAGSPDLAAR